MRIKWRVKQRAEHDMLDDDYFGGNTQKRCNLSHAREKIARVMRAKCGVLFTPPVDDKGKAISGERGSFLKKKSKSMVVLSF